MPFKDKPVACQGCPAYSSGKSYVPSRGPMSAAMAIIGQGPGELEAYQGRPFIGPSGQMLSEWLARARINESTIYIDNVVRCWMTTPNKRNRTPTAAETKFCWETHVKPSLESLPNLRVIIPCGMPASKRIIGKITSREVGNVFEVEL